MRVLTNKIYNRAKIAHDNEFPLGFTEDRVTESKWWKRWLETWYSTATEIRQEFIDEGLTESVDEITKVIKEQMYFLSPRERIYIEWIVKDVV